MHAGLCALALLLALGAVLGQQELRWDSPWAADQYDLPEPRSFASLAGLPALSTLYLYGGYSHARNAWLGDVWSQPLNATSAAPTWEQLSVAPGDLGEPLEHATLVALGGALVLVGGRFSNGTFNDGLYWLDPGKPAWLRLSSQVSHGPTGPDSVPPLYWHSAVPYSVQGSVRVLLCGGLDASGAAVDSAYELLYDSSAGAYSYTALDRMPAPLFGHSLAAGGDSIVYLSGGLSGSLTAVPRAAVPPGLRVALEAASPGPASPLAAQPAIYQFNRDAVGAAGGSSGEGAWAMLGGNATMPRACAFHASWVGGSTLYVYGGAQSASASPGSTPFGLHAFQLPTGPQDTALYYNGSVAQQAAAQWAAVQPGAVSGAAAWTDVSAGPDSQASLWLFGGWATPQPLPVQADTYLAPQDSSFLWRLDGSAAGAGQWQPPLQGGIAPRGGDGGGGALVVPVTVAGARKLLGLGGRVPGGWAGAGAGSRFLTDTSSLELGPNADPRVAAASYHISDIWLIDLATGARHTVWLVNSSTVSAGSPCLSSSGATNSGNTTTAAVSCSSLPFGTSVSPTSLGPVWDRRLLELPAPNPGRNGNLITSAPGGSNQALYMHAVEILGPTGVPTLQVGMWRLTISMKQLSETAGTVTVYTATWRDLTPSALPDSSDCYPRILHGAASLIVPPSALSTANPSSSGMSATSYIALHGGLLLKPSAPGSNNISFMSTDPTGSVCLFDVANRRWLAPPMYPKGFAPEARYRHACAARPGACFSMTCFGGVSAASGAALADAWTFSLMPGLTPGQGSNASMPQHAGTWTMAPSNYSAVRAGPRVDHLMLPIRGMNVTANASVSGCAAAAPLLLLGGALDAIQVSAAGTGAAGATAPRRDVWLLEATCADPDANDTVATSAGGGLYSRPALASQVWLPVYPNGSLAAVAAEAGASDPWVVAAAAVAQNEVAMEVWLVLLSGAGPSQPRAVRMVSPQGGCLALKPYCRNLSFPFDNSLACWPGAMPRGNTQLGDIRITAADGASVLSGSVGFVLQGPDGVPVAFRNTVPAPDGSYLLNDVVLPPGMAATSLTAVAYSRPYVEIERGQVTASGAAMPTVAMAFNRTSLALTVRGVNGTALANVAAELRVHYNGLYRKRRCQGLIQPADCDLASTSAGGVATFQIFPIQSAQPVPVSYVVLVNTPYYYGQYAAVLPSPLDSASGGSSSVTGANGGVVSLLQGSGLAYKLDLPSPIAPSPPPDGQISVNVTVSFRPSLIYYPLHLPNNRRWVASFYRYVADNGTESPFSINITDAYSTVAKIFSRRMMSGTYLIRVTDSLLPSKPLLEIPNRVIDSSASSVSLDVVMASVTFRVYFSRVVVSPGAGFTVGASALFVSLQTVRDASDPSLDLLAGSGGSGASALAASGFSTADAAWDSELTDGGIATFSLIPRMNYSATFFYPPNMVLKGPISIQSPPLNVSASGDGSGAAGGGTAVYEVELLQTLLCGAGTTTLINLQRGKFPDGVGSVVYGPATVCTWVIMTGLPLLSLTINTTGMAPGDALFLTTDSGATTRVPAATDAGSIFSVRVATTNVTLRFRANNESVIGSGPIVAWEGMDAASSMPPQFIMMIAASAAAAGAMLLFLCLWHCVFRPVQMRRQAQAAALSAAAAAAAGATAPGARAVTHRNRVPRRYLRMMETSTFSVKQATGGPTATAGSSAPGPPTGGGVGSQLEPVAAAGADAAPAEGAAVSPATGDQDSPPLSGTPASNPEALGGEVCAICLCDFEDGDRLKHLPCRHFYHVPCIEQWLGRDVTCPLCKDNVLEAMRTLFGPLPPRNPGRHAAATGTVPPAAPQHHGVEGAAPADPAAAPPAEGYNAGGGGAGAGVGGDLELVVIVEHGPDGGSADAADGSADAQSSGSRTGPLPGSTSQPDEQRAGRQPSPPAAFAAAAAAAPAGIATGGDGASAAAQENRPRGSASRSRAGLAPAAAELQPLRSAQSRELRASAHAANAGRDPAAEELEGSSTDSDSNTDDEPLDAAATERPAGPAAAAGRGLRPGSGGGGGLHRAGSGRAPAASPAAVAAAGAARAPWMEGSSRVPSPRPVTEAVQHSAGSTSGPAARRSGGSSQVVPEPHPHPLPPHPPPPATLVPHRLPRAQEAQMAVAAAAASAAAASASGGGGGGGAGGSSARHFGTGAAELPRPLIASASAPPLDGAACAAAGLLAYRIHNNPLAAQHSRTASVESSTSDEAAAHGTERPHRGSVTGHVSVTMGSPGHAHGSQAGGGGGSCGGGAAPGGHLRSAGVLAVPEVSGASGDLIRTPSAMARVAPGHGGGGAGSGPI